MANNRARNRRKSAAAATPEAIASAVAPAVAEAVSESVASALEPFAQKLDAALEAKQEPVSVDDATLELMGVEDPEQLESVLVAAADAAVEALEADGDEVAAAVVEAGLDTAEVVDELVKSRKARKDAGESLDTVTAEEVAGVIEEVAADIAENLTDEEVQQLEDDGFLEKEAEPEDKPGDGAKRRGGKKSRFARGRSRKSAYAGRKGANTPRIQRKYQDIYMNTKHGGVEEKPKLSRDEKAVRLTRAVKCMDFYACGVGGAPLRDPEVAAKMAIKMYGDHQLAKSFKNVREVKGMSVTEPSAGGYLVPQDMLSEIIELLYNETVIFELGARKISMPHGNLTIPKMTSGARARFNGEARNIKPSQPAVGQLKLSAKRLEGMVFSTEELLMSTDFSTDLIFGNDLLEQMKQGVEFGALLATGTEFQPLSIFANKKVQKLNLLTIGDTQLADAQGRPTPDLPIYLCGQVFKKNVRGSAFGWTFNSDMETYLKRMKSDDGSYIWKDEMAGGTLNGYPYRTTNLIDTAANGTTIMIFGLWSDLLVGDQMGLTTRTSYDATVQTDDGIVNLFQSGQTATRAFMYMDTGLRHDESFLVATNVKVLG